MDEPTSALDPEAVLKVEGVFRSLLRAGKAIVWISHSHEQVRGEAAR